MRQATITRKTNETDITLTLTLDGKGSAQIETGVGFFDHMLTSLARHSGMSVNLRCKGDLQVDCHHAIEDTGIVLGMALKQALGETPVARFGSAYVPMDEALAFCALDICSRAYLVFDCAFKADRMGDMSSQMVYEFFRAMAYNAGLTLHLRALYGENDHHKCEALFKAFANALKIAVRKADSLQTTKGSL